MNAPMSPISTPETPAINRSAAPRPTTQMTVGCLLIPLLLAGLLAILFIAVRANANPEITVPNNEVVLVRAAPEDAAPLLARFGEGRSLLVVGRSLDWRWLKVETWDGQEGWALRPLDILVWQIEADVVDSEAIKTNPPPVTPVPQEMVAIPATSFTMGSPPGLGKDDERPAHSVSLSAFEIERTEVTVGQYWQCVTAGVCSAPSSDSSPSAAYYFNDPAFDNHPAINIPWSEARNFCSWRGKRLPTEAEWELAAGWDIDKQAKLLWPWGNADPPGPVNAAQASLGEPTPVGSFPADQSPAGLLDMGGNVSEWVFDWYKADYYSVADSSDPSGPTHRRGEGSGRVVRGGSYADGLPEARAANRRHQVESYGYATVGFRCVQD